MKRSKLTKIIVSSLIAISVIVLNPIGTSAEWRQSENGWWYSEEDSWATGWRQIDGNWYYFDSNGYIVRNKVIGKYFVNKNGAWVDDSKYNVTAIEAQEIVKQYFIDKGWSVPRYVCVEEEYGDNAWGVHCYNIEGYVTVVYGWFFVDKTTGKILNKV